MDSSGTFIWVLDVNGNFYIDTGKEGNKLCHALFVKIKIKYQNL